MKYSYTDSGIEWLGKVPGHWKVTRLAALGLFGKGRGIPKADLVDDPNAVHAILYGDIYTKYEYSTDQLLNRVSETTAASATEVHCGDLIMAGSGETNEEIGKCVLYKGTARAVAGGDIIIFRPRKDNGAFLSYLLNSPISIFQKASTAKGDIVVHTYPSKLRSIRFPLPPPEEQAAIASYLDSACAKLDRVIAIKEEQLGRLDETVKARLAHITTKGLDNKVSMQAVACHWIREVPSHWKITRVKNVCGSYRGKFSHRPRNDPRFYGGEYPFIQTGDITSSAKYITSYTQTLNELGLSVSKMFPAGTLTMSIAANIGDVAILNFDACFPDSVVGFKPHGNVDLDYLYYAFIALRQNFLGSAILTTQLNLNLARIGVIEFYVPPMDEQKEIVKAIEQLTTRVEEVKKRVLSQIETLKTYRRSLIHECVTGKKQVYMGFRKNRKEAVA